MRGRRSRRGVFALLYLGEGAPIGFIWWALPALFAQAGLAVDAVTAFTATLVLPWIFKFAWAPAVDAWRGPRWGRRAWVVAAQWAMGLTLLPLAFVDWGENLGLVRALLLTHTLAAATQDVAVDGWAVAATDPSERGALNGWMQAGYLTGRWLFGAGVLLALSGERVGREAVVLGMVATIWATMLVVLVATREGAGPVEGGGRGFGRALLSALGARRTWIGLGLAATGGAGFEAMGAVAGPLLTERGFGGGAIGWFYTATVPCMIGGALLGGRVADIAGKRAAFAAFVVVVAALVLLAAGAEALRWPAGLMGAMVAGYFGIGLFTAASYALFMDLTDPRLGGTQFSAYMGATNGCEAWAGLAAGALAVRWGYAPALVTLAAASLAALPLLWALGRDAAVDAEGKEQ